MAAALLALRLASWVGVHTLPADGILDTVQAALRATVAAMLLFLVGGFGLTRLLLPEHARRYELLWAPAVGGCAVGLTMTVLGFAYVPFEVSLAVTIAAGLALAAVALRRTGGEYPSLRGLGWPVYVGALLVAVALTPYFSAGFPTVTGYGADAVHAVGAAEFLQDNHPTAVDEDAPQDEMPPKWKSKQPIYYALGAVAWLSGLEPYETITPAAAIVLGLAALGMFLLARELLGAGLAAGVLVMTITSLDAMVLRTILHPYFNQSWGYLAFPFSLVLAWWAVRDRDRRAAVLLAIFVLLGALAYPLAAPIPALAIAVFFAVDLRERKRRGEPTRLPALGRLRPRGRRLLWVVPLALLLALPAAAAIGKGWDAAQLLFDPNASLEPWGGDLFDFVPAYQFFSLGTDTLWWLAVAAMVVLATWLLAQVPRPVGWGLGAALVTFFAAAIWFRQRDFGWYFEFKTLAFAAPLLVACAVVALSRLGRVGAVILLAFVVSAAFAARPELRTNVAQLTEDQLELREWSEDLPRDASIRFDTSASHQMWGAYMLHRQPLCSQRPLLGTDYPRVPFSRRADYILVDVEGRRFYRRAYDGRVKDADGGPVRSNDSYWLYRMRSDVPGPELCSRRQVYDSR